MTEQSSVLSRGGLRLTLGILLHDMGHAAAAAHLSPLAVDLLAAKESRSVLAIIAGQLPKA